MKEEVLAGKENGFVRYTDRSVQFHEIFTKASSSFNSYSVYHRIKGKVCGLIGIKNWIGSKEIQCCGFDREI
jgi:hypothetical protein